SSGCRTQTKPVRRRAARIVKILKPSGFFIVEDITSSKIALWQTVAALLPPNYSPKLIQGKFRLLFMMQKPGYFEPVISSACPFQLTGHDLFLQLPVGVALREAVN